MNKLWIIIVVLAFFYTRSVSQTSCYILVDDPTMTLVAKNQKRENMMGRINTQNLKFNKLMNKLIRKGYTQAFPNAYSKWLQRIYLIESDNIPDIVDSLSLEFKNEIPLIEPLCENKSVLSYTPNDFTLLEGLGHPLDLIKAREAWDITRGLPKVNAAINDTRFDLNHPDLNFLGVKGSNNSTASNNAHGTEVAGCLSAITDNGIGVSSSGGFNTNIFGSTNIYDDYEILELAKSGYKIINCSWLNSCTYIRVKDSIYHEIRNTWNAIVVSAAGNTSDLNQCGSLNAKVYPASYNDVVSVTTVGHAFDIGQQYQPPTGPPVSVSWKDVHEQLVGDPSSSYHHNDAVDICAPGYGIQCPTLGGGYIACWGTSFSSPIVAGVCAMIWSVNPCLTANQVVDILLSTADSSIYAIPENAAYIGKLGKGRVDAFAAVKKAGTRKIENVTYFSTAAVTAAYKVDSKNTTINSGANVSFKSRREIELGANFEVKAGGVFETLIDNNLTVTCP